MRANSNRFFYLLRHGRAKLSQRAYKARKRMLTTERLGSGISPATGGVLPKWKTLVLDALGYVPGLQVKPADTVPVEPVQVSVGLIAPPLRGCGSQYTGADSVSVNSYLEMVVSQLSAVRSRISEDSLHLYAANFQRVVKLLSPPVEVVESKEIPAPPVQEAPLKPTRHAKRDVPTVVLPRQTFIDMKMSIKNGLTIASRANSAMVDVLEACKPLIVGHDLKKVDVEILLAKLGVAAPGLLAWINKYEAPLSKMAKLFDDLAGFETWTIADETYKRT